MIYKDTVLAAFLKLLSFYLIQLQRAKNKIKNKRPMIVEAKSKKCLQQNKNRALRKLKNKKLN